MSTDANQDTNSQANSDQAAAEAAAKAGAAAGAGAGDEEQQQSQKAPDQKTVSQDAYRTLQSRADRAEAELRRAREDSERAVAEARKAGRDATLSTLKPEERDAQIRAWNLEDRERRFEAAEREQESTARALTVQKLGIDYTLDDEAKAELEKIDDVNEMRARAAELRVETLQRQLEDAKNGAGQQKPGEEKKPPAGMRQTPENSGGGSQQGAYDAAKFRRSGDVAGSMRAQREAGLVKYEKVPVRGR